MPRKRKSKVSHPIEEKKPITVEVTLLKNGYIREKFFPKGATVQVEPEIKAYLVKTSPEVYQ